MKSLMAGRSDARRQVMQMLYLVDQNPDADLRRIENSIRQELNNPALSDFAWKLFCGVLQAREQLDRRIRATASNWRLERMTITDRNVLRLGLFEMEQYGTPAAVVLNECIEMARDFGTEQSASFVNGILDKLIPRASASTAEASTGPLSTESSGSGS